VGVLDGRSLREKGRGKEDQSVEAHGRWLT
jgi:hypothetical protein